jgi:hypothetical protein
MPRAVRYTLRALTAASLLLSIVTAILWCSTAWWAVIVHYNIHNGLDAVGADGVNRFRFQNVGAASIGGRIGFLRVRAVRQGPSPTGDAARRKRCAGLARPRRAAGGRSA